MGDCVLCLPRGWEAAGEGRCLPRGWEVAFCACRGDGLAVVISSPMMSWCGDVRQGNIFVV